MKVLSSNLHRFRFLLAIPFLLFHRRLFAMDLETVRSVGKASNRYDVNTILEEFHNYNRLERGRRRKFLKIRLSGTRLMALFVQYEPMISPPVIEDPLAGAPKNLVNPPAMTGSPISPRQGKGGIPNTTVLRKTRQVLNGLVAGRSIELLLSEADLTEGELMEGLSSNAQDNPGFGWFLDQLRLQKRYDSAQKEISELHRIVASQSRELAQFKENQRVLV